MYKCEKIEQGDRDKYVCSSLSADSVVGGSSNEDVCTEEIVDDEGVSELVLIPRREVRVIIDDTTDTVLT